MRTKPVTTKNKLGWLFGYFLQVKIQHVVFKRDSRPALCDRYWQRYDMVKGNGSLPGLIIP